PDLIVSSVPPSRHHRHLHSFPTRRSSDLARAGFARIAALFSGEEVVTEHLICHGHVGHMITEEANRLEADLIAIGAQGHSALARDRKSTRLNSSHVKISYAVFCLKKKRLS